MQIVAIILHKKKKYFMLSNKATVNESQIFVLTAEAVNKENQKKKDKLKYR